MKNSTTSTKNQIQKRIDQLNNLIVKFPRVRSLIRKWAFELTVLEGRLEALKAVAVKAVESPRQLTIWDVPVVEKIEQFPHPDQDELDWLFQNPPSGTEKQSSWAGSIRIDFIQGVIESHCSLRGEVAMGHRIDWLKSHEEMSSLLEAASNADAKFWIETRKEGYIAILNKLLKS
jgi:hypothetical protein